MITRFLLQLRILPRWVIIILDLTIVAFSTFLGYLLRFNFDLNEIFLFNIELGLLINTISCLFALFITKSYAGIVRYTGLKDGLRVLYTLIITHLLTSFINLLYHYNTGNNLIPFSVILISLLASFVFMFQYRLLIKNIFSYYRSLSKEKQNVAIFGAGQMGMITKHLLDDDANSNYRASVFFEDDPNLAGKEINGTLIYSFEKLSNVIQKEGIKELIIAIQNLSIERKNEIVDQCLKDGVKVRTVPTLDKWVKGELSLNQIKDINIDDLLERDSIELNNDLIAEHIKDKRILITGAAGSIGSGLVYQLISYGPSELILLDQSESALYEIFRTLLSNDGLTKVIAYVADITDEKRIKSIFNKHMPQIVYHAAAYKHVPFMEDNVVEAVRCNILGTRILADSSLEFNVDKFVMVSTDKAVNPTNVMGSSKRVAEIYVQSLNGESIDATRFVTTRFGNVLGSNGSVIPYFKTQIAQGGPVTVTHPEITRYFMTINEACELVVEAGAMGKGGEIYLFDMGRSVKIVDLAKKMIKLSGYMPYEDIDIIFTGLRKGEKLYEELLATKENTLPTHHEKILIAKVKEYDYESISYQIKSIEQIINAERYDDEVDYALVAKMKEIVPEYISQSSKFSNLDKPVG